MVVQSIGYGSIWPDQHVFAPLEDQLVADLEAATTKPASVRRYQNESDMLADLKAGALQFGSTSSVQSLVPQASIMYLPYLYRDWAHFREIWGAGDNLVTRKINDEILQKAEMIVLGYTTIGARDCILVDKPIRKLSDFGGLEIRVDGAAVSQELFKALGAAPRMVPYYDVEQALSTKSVMAGENSPFNMLALGWDRPCRYLSLTGHRFILNYELVHQRFWGALDSAKRSVVTTAFSDFTAKFSREAEIARTASLARFRAAKHIAVNQVSETDQQDIAAAVRSFVDQFAVDHGLVQEIDWIRNGI